MVSIYSMNMLKSDQDSMGKNEKKNLQDPPLTVVQYIEITWTIPCSSEESGLISDRLGFIACIT